MQKAKSSNQFLKKKLEKGEEGRCTDADGRWVIKGHPLFLKKPEIEVGVRIFIKRMDLL